MVLEAGAEKFFALRGVTPAKPEHDLVSRFCSPASQGEGCEQALQTAGPLEGASIFGEGLLADATGVGPDCRG
jgi:hypothetical protein